MISWHPSLSPLSQSNSFVLFGYFLRFLLILATDDGPFNRWSLGLSGYWQGDALSSPREEKKITAKHHKYHISASLRFLNFPFVCQNISACLKLNRPRFIIVYCYMDRANLPYSGFAKVVEPLLEVFWGGKENLAVFVSNNIQRVSELHRFRFKSIVFA